MNDPDEWLMHQVAAGQSRCLEPLVRRYAGPLLTFIQRLVGQRHNPEEIFQDVFLAVWPNARRIAIPRRFARGSTPSPRTGAGWRCAAMIHFS